MTRTAGGDVARRVFRTAAWYRVLSVAATLALCEAGAFYVLNGAALWHRISGWRCPTLAPMR